MKIIFFIILVIIFIYYFRTKEVYFQNSDIIVNKQNLLKVRNELYDDLKSIVSILDKYNIRYTLAGYNLLEYFTKKENISLDSITIRIFNEDFDKWMSYCQTLQQQDNTYIDTKYNLIFGNNANNKIKQLEFGIKLSSMNTCQENIFINIIPAICVPPNAKYFNYDIDFNKLQKIKYLNLTITIPNKNDTDNILQTEFGDKYFNYIDDTYFSNNKFYYKN